MSFRTMDLKHCKITVSSDLMFLIFYNLYNKGYKILNWVENDRKVHKCEVAKSKMAYEESRVSVNIGNDIAKFPLLTSPALHSPSEMVF